ncbi:MAG TPA: hypothetical protein VFO46_17720 [Candidatus Sulfotelmatobacter sp.]|nr:hypothetical protein [Candidatus Sulfotelmatobacter sp.]
MSEKVSKVPVTFSLVAIVISVLFLVSAASAQSARTVSVDCNNGQSLSATLAKLNKQIPVTVLVQGICTEFVTIDGFEGLTLKGQSGAVLQQPATNPLSNSYVLSITGSRGITVFGLTVQSLPSIFSGIGIGKGSNEVLLQNVNVNGSWGIVVNEESQVWLLNVNVTISSGFAAISAFDKSDVHIAGGTLQRPSDNGFYAGVFVGSGHVTMQGMTIRDMQDGITIGTSGSVDLVDVVANAPTDVTIDNPSGTNVNGAIVSDGSSLNVGSARLIIKNAGQTYGATTGAVFVTNNSTLNAGSNLLVSNSQGQGLIVTNNSHATLAGSSITRSLHGGMVAANLSTIDVQPASSLTLVGGNAPDLFCDSNSFITGTANLAGVPTANCANLLSGNTVPLP